MPKLNKILKRKKKRNKTDPIEREHNLLVEIKQLVIVFGIVLIFLFSVLVYCLIPSVQIIVERNKIENAVIIENSLKEEGSSYVRCNCKSQCTVLYGEDRRIEYELLDNGNCLCKHPNKGFFIIKTDEVCPEYGLFTNIIKKESDEKRQDELNKQ